MDFDFDGATDLDFDGLLLRIRDGRVAAVVGAALYVDDAGVSIEQTLAGRLAAALEVAEPDTAVSLRRVALTYLRKPDSRSQTLRSELRRLYGEVLPVPPAPLRQLAAIDSVTLYVTTTPDGMLEQALREAGREPIVRCYARERPAIDLPPLGDPAAPVVVHLFGSLATDAFAVTDADVVEYLYALAGDARRPKQLFDELRERSLMFVGLGFPDWLLRLFIRTIKGTPFARDEDYKRVVADITTGDRELSTFLQAYNHDLWRPRSGSSVAFVETLHDRWQASRQTPAAAPPPHSTGLTSDGSVFLSFSSADRATVRALADALREAGIDPYFFDEQSIQPGDEWDPVIRNALIRAALVLPFVSQHTEVEGNQRYFWREWRIAQQRAEYEPPGARYILPIVLDDGIDPAKAQVVESFRAVQWFRLTERSATPEFIDFVKTEYRKKMLARRRS